MVEMITRQRWVMGLMSLAHCETCNQLRQYGIERGQRKAYAKPLPLPFTYTPGVFAYLFKLLEQGDALLIEKPACFGQLQWSAALKQCCAQMFFQLLNLATQVRLAMFRRSAARVKFKVFATAWK